MLRNAAVIPTEEEMPFASNSPLLLNILLVIPDLQQHTGGYYGSYYFINVEIKWSWLATYSSGKRNTVLTEWRTPSSSQVVKKKKKGGECHKFQEMLLRWFLDRNILESLGLIYHSCSDLKRIGTTHEIKLAVFIWTSSALQLNMGVILGLDIEQLLSTY